MAQIAQSHSVASSAPQKKRFLWFWSKTKEAQLQSSPAAQLATVQPVNFYEKAIEWTHRADKIINLVLGYLLAIASVLGFMDVLSNGQVLVQVPFMFYIWLGIMGLGVDFQILLVIGRIPDLFRMPTDNWQKWLIFLFNVLFLVFLCVMSVMTSAIFTQHRDVPLMAMLNPLTHQIVNGETTMTDAMAMLGINSILFVYGRAVLATLLLVLMAVDRTMERWRMQIIATQQHVAQPAVSIEPQQELSQPEPLQATDLDKILQAVAIVNQQNLQVMQEMNRETIEQVSQMTEKMLNRFTTTVLFSGASGANNQTTVNQMLQDFQQEEHTTDTDKLVALDISEKFVLSDQSAFAFEKNYSAKIEALLQQEPDLTDRDIAARVGCSLRTASRWKSRVQQTTH